MPILEVAGMWWLPGQKEKKIPGFLSFDLDNGGQLKLIGALTELEDFATHRTIPGGQTYEIDDATIEAAGSFNRIYGEAGGKLSTLEHCFESHRSGGVLYQHVPANYSGE